MDNYNVKDITGEINKVEGINTIKYQDSGHVLFYDINNYLKESFFRPIFVKRIPRSW